jgi:hypothetical protein
MVTVPDRAADYLLDVDLVEEGVCWFGDVGSAFFSAPVRVKEAHSVLRRWRSSPAPSAKGHVEASAVTEPEPFAMHAIPRDEIERIVASAGGVIAGVSSSGAAGPDWEAYRYLVTRE